MTTPFAVGHEAIHGGPVEHLAGIRARTVLRVRRNALGVLPILGNTSALLEHLGRNDEVKERDLPAALQDGATSASTRFYRIRSEISDLRPI
jgi:hypothetical protein